MSLPSQHPNPAADAEPSRPASQACNPRAFIDIFEARLRSVRNGALLIASLHLLSRSLGFVAFIWATVVLLAGFGSSLRTFDFLLVTVLLLLEGVRCFIMRVSVKISLKPLFRESHHPEEFEFKDTQYIKANRLDVLCQAISLILAFSSLIPTTMRVILPGGPAIFGNESQNNSNLAYALYIFYALVMVNSYLAIIYTLLRRIFRHKCNGKHSDNSLIKQNCLIRYHDDVYKTAMHVGLLEVGQLDILEFAFTKLASDYKRNIRPPLIEAQNKDLIDYLYCNQQGIAMCCEYLKGPDVWKQVVAANLPGFWAEELRIELQVALFWALRNRMYGAGKDAESALNSIQCLGRSWADMPVSQPYPFLINDPAVATNIIDTLVHLLLEPIRPTLLFQLRAFEACCQNRQVLQHMFEGRSPQEAHELCQQLQAMVAGKQGPIAAAVSLQELCRKLLTYVSQKGIWMTTKIYAGNALLSLLCYGTGEVAEEVRKSLQGPVGEYIDPASACVDGAKLPYFWLNDAILVERMRKKLRMPRYGRWEGVRIRSPNGTELPLKKALALIEPL